MSASSDLFRPTTARLGQGIYENLSEGIDPHLQFFIEIAFEPVEIDGETHQPLFRVDRIVVPVRSFRELENMATEFPWAPKPGSVDAAMLLFGEHNPADVTRIEFGVIEDGALAVRFETEIDFEIEADRDDLEQVEMAFSLPLVIEPLRISTSLEKRMEGEVDAIRDAISGIVDLASYGPLEKAPGGFVLSAT